MVMMPGDMDAQDPVTEVEQPDKQHIVVARQVYPARLPLVPLPNRPMFPRVVAPLAIETPALEQLFKEAIDSQSRLVGLVLSKEDTSDGHSASGKGPDLYRVGVIAQVLNAGPAPDTGQLRVLLGGLDRFEVVKIVSTDPYPVAAVRYLYEDKTEPDDELKAYALAIINSIKELVQNSPLFKEELSLLLGQGNMEDPARLADYAAYLTSANGEQLQRVLETLDVRQRLERSLELLRRELDISKLQTQIRQQIEERISKQQREFFLREQLKAIKKELGLEKDEKETEIAEFLARLEKRTPSPEAQERIDEEVHKLRLLEPVSPEFTVTRNYLDWLTALPWGVTTGDDVDLATARGILDEKHYGLGDVKERILEFIAAGLLKGSFAGSIICLVGPPGVGKTSIGRSIARSLGREFYRFSLGGMRDEAEIKGHRRTYIGAMPGKFIQALRVVKTQNPVIMLDEIDKIGASFQGDPASALLEALDPEQNRDFLDHYLDVRFDLSNVLFVCTANQLDTIPAPLLDRMEIIKLSGYILEEKLAIAERYLVPRELAELGLKRNRLSINRAALKEVIDGYARDAGVRLLEQQIRKIVRKSAVKLLEDKRASVRVGRAEVGELLGKRLFHEQRQQKPIPGEITGLAWTSMGGDTLIIQATRIESERPGFKQTGQLGKVMIESSEIAYTYARALCSHDDKTKRFFDQGFIHLHVPAGATPKDGPSAGVTMAAALYSLARDKPIKPGYAMTGELDLLGHVLPVGGIKEKMIAARRAGVRHVVLPADNQDDFETLPAHVRKGLTAYFVAHFSEIVAICL